MTYIHTDTHFSDFFIFFIAPVEGLCCKPKYRANMIYHFICVLFPYFFHHSSYRKDQFIVLILNLVLKMITSRYALGHYFFRLIFLGSHALSRVVYLTDFLKTNLTKFAVIWVKRRQKACFLSPTEKLQNHSNEGKRKSENKEKKQWLHC